VTKEIWEQIKRWQIWDRPFKRQWAQPAVGLTLTNLNTGKELPMETSFDNFSNTVHPHFRALPEQISQNRDLLKTIMEK